MSDIAISAERLSKFYTIRHSVNKPVYSTLQESLMSLPKRMFGQKETPETFWALKDVSFEIKQGERIGIIGRNGAGKSTLLKLLSRITEPTSGQALINGRVASLLEVGTGFHPELTGRENIFMNGAILGMSQVEIRKKFDDIVAFAEVEKFLDTPVKRYSSGMYVRLAFAVAAHLEPEILLVDEVLAVGDAQFQKKCMGKMEEVSKSEGRTILFVSHNMTAIEGMCTSGIVLENGRIKYNGNVLDAIKLYFNTSAGPNAEKTIDLRDQKSRKPGSTRVFRDIAVVTKDNIGNNIISIGEPVEFKITLDPEGKNYHACAVGLGIFNSHGMLIVPFRSVIQHQRLWSLESSKEIRVLWEDCNITPGVYKVTIAFASEDHTIDFIEEALYLEVRIKGQDGVADSMLDTGGIIVPKVTWMI
jgi:lipopolysaccharide transport system ATP-binding protein